MEKQKKAVEAQAIQNQKDKEKIAPYLERIDNLVEDEKKANVRQVELDEQALFQAQKEKESDGELYRSTMECEKGRAYGNVL